MCIIYIYICRYDIYVLLSFGNSLKDEGRVEFLDSNLSKALQRQRLWSGGLSFGLSHLGQQHSTRFGYLVNCFGGLCNPSDAEKNIMDMIWKWKCVDAVIFMVRCAIYLCVFSFFCHHYCGCCVFFCCKKPQCSVGPNCKATTIIQMDWWLPFALWCLLKVVQSEPLPGMVMNHDESMYSHSMLSVYVSSMKGKTKTQKW